MSGNSSDKNCVLTQWVGTRLKPNSLTFCQNHGYRPNIWELDITFHYQLTVADSCLTKALSCPRNHYYRHFTLDCDTRDMQSLRPSGQMGTKSPAHFHYSNKDQCKC